MFEIPEVNERMARWHETNDRPVPARLWRLDEGAAKALLVALYTQYPADVARLLETIRTETAPVYS